MIIMKSRMEMVKEGKIYVIDANNQAIGHENVH